MAGRWTTDRAGRPAADMHGGHALCCVTFGNAKSDVRARAPEHEREQRQLTACNYSPVAAAVAHTMTHACIKARDDGWELS